MTDRELMQMALEKLEKSEHGYFAYYQVIKALRDRLAQEEPWVKTYCGGKPNYTTQPDLATVGEVGVWGELIPCKEHPDAPHGFDRNASHSEDRYVCECEYWDPPLEPKPVAWICEANDWDTWKPSLCWVKSENKCFRNWKPLYTAPKGWVGLTEEEIFEHEWWDEETAFHINKYLKEKNT